MQLKYEKIKMMLYLILNLFHAKRKSHLLFKINRLNCIKYCKTVKKQAIIFSCKLVKFFSIIWLKKLFYEQKYSGATTIPRFALDERIEIKKINKSIRRLWKREDFYLGSLMRSKFLYLLGSSNWRRAWF
jgi:hypothetical protein